MEVTDNQKDFCYDRSFGVEIEFSNPEIDKGHHMAFFSIGNKQAIECKCLDFELKSLDGWEIKPDGSCLAEIVSKPLYTVRPIFELLDNDKLTSHMYPYDSGLHIHVDASGFSKAELKDIARVFIQNQEIILSFMEPWRHDSEYSGRINDSDIEDFLNPHSEQLDCDRYKHINLWAFNLHGTIEYRCASTTSDPIRIAALVDFFVKFTDWAATELPKNTIPPSKDGANWLLDSVGVEDCYRPYLAGWSELGMYRCGPCTSYRSLIADKVCIVEDNPNMFIVDDLGWWSIMLPGDDWWSIILPGEMHHWYDRIRNESITTKYLNSKQWRIIKTNYLQICKALLKDSIAMGRDIESESLAFAICELYKFQTIDENIDRIIRNSIKFLIYILCKHDKVFADSLYRLYD